MGRGKKKKGEKLLPDCCVNCKYLKVKRVTNPHRICMHLWGGVVINIEGSSLSRKIKKRGYMNIYFCGRHINPEVKLYINTAHLKKKICSEYERI